MARRRGNPLALAVLACLTERPMHPYEMAATMRTRGQDASIRLNYGSLYGVVETLLKRGLIEEQEVVREGRRPERTVYRITDDGRTEVDEWMAELLGTSAKEFPQFEAGLSLMGVLPPDRVLAPARPTGGRVAGAVVRARRHRGGATGNGVPRAVPRGDGLRARRSSRPTARSPNSWPRDIESERLDGVTFWKSFHAERTHDEHEEKADT